MDRPHYKYDGDLLLEPDDDVTVLDSI